MTTTRSLPVYTFSGFASKAFYVVTFVLLLCMKLPSWLLNDLVPSRRPRQTWDFRRSFFVRMFKHSAVSLALELGLGIGGNGRDPRAPVHESDMKDAKHIFVEPFPLDYIKGEVKKYVEKAQVGPEKIGGYWFGKRGEKGGPVPPPEENEMVVMHCHGGAYLGTAHPEDSTAWISRGVLQHCNSIITRTFSIDYRLCSAPPYPTESPFPAALLDALAGYYYLLNFGFKAKNIILMGDSAGGNLALALTRYLVENPIADIPPPGALLLLSPWCDITASHEGLHPESSSYKNNHSDYLCSPNAELAQWTIKAFLGPMSMEEARTNPYISPSSLHLSEERLNGLFKGFPRTYVLAGGAERILDEIRTLRDRLQKDLMPLSSGSHAKGEVAPYEEEIPWVTYDEVDDALHDFLMFPWHQPEVDHTLQRINIWMQGLAKVRDRTPVEPEESFDEVQKHVPTTPLWVKYDGSGMWLIGKLAHILYPEVILV
ncbi:hypothetical protein FRC02_010697 [Tulasnella sp. 418]|nr:hypothetical protein FRC02_010697 [Tulasnella sp. 418]